MKFSASLFRSPEALRAPARPGADLPAARRLRDADQRGGRRALRAAQANPEAYRDLVVRIGGYTDYFTRLSPEMQAEVILRTEYERCLRG